MYLTNPLLLSLLTSTALAFPTTSQNDTTTIFKRSHSGFVGSYPNPTCNGVITKPAAENLDNPDTCYKWTPTPGQKIGVNFGAGIDKQDAVRFFTDDSCQHSAGAQGYEHQDNSQHGMLCLSTHMDTHSVKMFYDPDWHNQFWTP